MINICPDRTIPEGTGQIAIGNPLSGENILIEPRLIKQNFESEVKKMEEYIESLFMENGGDFTLLQTDIGFVDKIIELFKMRETKWR